MLVDWLILNSIHGLGPVRIKRLLEQFGSPEAILREPAERLARSAGLAIEDAAQMHATGVRDEALRQIETAERTGVAILSLESADYPPLLREIFAPPPVLFVRGAVDVFRRHALGVVGTRAPTPYGRQAATVITRQIAEAGVAIVSGLALGIDSLAHEACLAAGGRTVAVFGCGIDGVYPQSNRGLAERIMEQGGALVSEFPLGTPPLRPHFPRRNRIISGLAAGVLVVEAGVRSGSLITASYALQQGRDVFAVPGPIFSDRSIGTFNLIKSGATPVRTAADILDSLQVLTHSAALPARPAPAFPQELLSEEERGVLSRISDAPLRFDQLAASTGGATPDLLDILLNLELKGAIRQLAGQQYVRA